MAKRDTQAGTGGTVQELEVPAGVTIPSDATQDGPSVAGAAAIAGDGVAQDVASVAGNENFIDPDAEKDIIKRRLRLMAEPIMLKEHCERFLYVRSRKWAISRKNGIPEDITDPGRTFRGGEHLRAAAWHEVATSKQGFDMDVRGENHQLWYRQPEMDPKTGKPIRDDEGFIKYRDARPVKGMNDDTLAGQMAAVKQHWVSVIRPDMYARWERLQSQGANVDLPGVVASDKIPAALNLFEMDMNMAEAAITGKAKG
jgi:hypothetical protein